MSQLTKGLARAVSRQVLALAALQNAFDV